MNSDRNNKLNYYIVYWCTTFVKINWVLHLLLVLILPDILKFSILEVLKQWPVHDVDVDVDDDDHDVDDDDVVVDDDDDDDRGL